MVPSPSKYIRTHLTSSRLNNACVLRKFLKYLIEYFIAATRNKLLLLFTILTHFKATNFLPLSVFFGYAFAFSCYYHLTWLFHHSICFIFLASSWIEFRFLHSSTHIVKELNEEKMKSLWKFYVLKICLCEYLLFAKCFSLWICILFDMLGNALDLNLIIECQWSTSPQWPAWYLMAKSLPNLERPYDQHWTIMG